MVTYWLGAWVAATSSALFAPIYLAMQVALGSAAGGRVATVVALVSPVGKYLPGKFGSLVGAIWIYRCLWGRAHACDRGDAYCPPPRAFAALSFLLVPFLVAGGLVRLPSDLLRWLFLGVWAGGLILAFPRTYSCS
jgi:hypothetical protein